MAPSPNRAKTYQEIVDDANKQLLDWQATERRINADINAIKDKAWDRQLTPEEQKQIAELRSEKAAVLDAIEELGFVTLGALEKTEELKRLVHSLSAIRRDLDGRRAKIEKFAEGATKLAGMIASLDNIVTKANGLLQTVQGGGSRSDDD